MRNMFMVADQAIIDASVASAVFADNMFDDVSGRNDEGRQATEAIFKPTIVSIDATHELFCDRPLADVIWDAEVVHELNTFDPAMYVEPEVQNPTYDATYSVFDEVPLGDVNWDVMSTEPMVHEGLLQQLAQGTEEKMQCKQVPFEAPIMLEGMHQGGDCCVSGGEHLDSNNSEIFESGDVEDIRWDEELLLDRPDSHDIPLKALIMFEEGHQGEENLIGNEKKLLVSGVSALVGINIDSVVIDETYQKDVVGDNIPSDGQTHDNVVQQLVTWDGDVQQNLDLCNNHLEKCTSVKHEKKEKCTSVKQEQEDKMLTNGMTSRSENSVMSEQQQEVTDRQLVPIEYQPWRNAFNPGRFEIEASCLFISAMQSEPMQATVVQPIQPIIEISSKLFSQEAKKAASTSPQGSNANAKVQEAIVATQVLLSSESTPDGATSRLAGGVTDLKGTSLGELKELQSNIHHSVRMQWDPGISTATAWGQAVFRGADNVMTRIETEGSPKAIEPVIQLQPAQGPTGDSVHYTRFGQLLQKTSNQNIRKSILFLRWTSSLRRSCSGGRSPVCSTATPCTRAHVPVVAHRWPWDVT